MSHIWSVFLSLSCQFYSHGNDLNVRIDSFSFQGEGLCRMACFYFEGLAAIYVVTGIDRRSGRLWRTWRHTETAHQDSVDGQIQ